MGTLLSCFVIIVLVYIFCFIFAGNAKIIIGTISKKTEDCKSDLKQLGYKIIHADDFRNQNIDYKKSGILVCKKFLKNLFLFKKVALFTSSPKLLKWKWLTFFTFGIFSIEDKRTTRSENIEWVLDLSPEDAVKIIPDYLVSKNEIGYGDVKAEKMIKELNRYSDDRFLPKKKQFNFGYLGGIITE